MAKKIKESMLFEQRSMNKWVLFILGIFLGFLVGWFLFGFVGVADANVEIQPQKVWLCHCQPQKGCVTILIPVSAIRHHIGQHEGDHLGQCVTPTPTPTKKPKPTPTPDPVCEIETWTCEDCQSIDDDICYGDKKEYCGENYGCYWNEVCETDLKKDKPCQFEWVCKDTCEDPEPTPEPEPTKEPEKPSGCTTNCNPPAPVCTADAVVNEPANFHVYRSGDDAILKWNPTGGNQVIAYWRNPAESGWEHSVKAENTGFLEIHDLGTHDWTFGLEQVNDCGGGVLSVGRMMQVEDGNTHRWILFR